VFEQTKTGEHAPGPEIAEKCYKAMRARQRTLYPQQVNLRSTRPDPTFNRVDWVQVYQPLSAGLEKPLFLNHGSGKIILSENALSVQAAFTTPNKIEAKTDNVQTLRFYLNDQMVDLGKPVTVVINGKTRFEGMVEANLDAMLKDQLFLGRGWRYFTAVLDIDLAPSATTKPTTRRTIAATTATKLYFTVDDGKTFFELEASNRAPFVHEEKPAFRAHVFSCDGGKTAFVGYLSKFSPISDEPLVRKPGMNQWSPLSSAGAGVVLDVKCPEGVAGKTPVEIFPK
jgi:hypothetical protein